MGDILGNILFTLGKKISKLIFYWASFLKDLGYFFKTSGHTSAEFYANICFLRSKKCKWDFLCKLDLQSFVKKSLPGPTLGAIKKNF